MFSLPEIEGQLAGGKHIRAIKNTVSGIRSVVESFRCLENRWRSPSSCPLDTRSRLTGTPRCDRRHDGFLTLCTSTKVMNVQLTACQIPRLAARKPPIWGLDIPGAYRDGKGPILSFTRRLQIIPPAPVVSFADHTAVHSLVKSINKKGKSTIFAGDHWPFRFAAALQGGEILRLHPPKYHFTGHSNEDVAAKTREKIDAQESGLKGATRWSRLSPSSRTTSALLPSRPESHFLVACDP